MYKNFTDDQLHLLRCISKRIFTKETIKHLDPDLSKRIEFWSNETIKEVSESSNK
jgi:hypothetical protein